MVSTYLKNPAHRLLIALVVTSFIFVLQFIGGIVTNSLSLVANAGHFLGDMGSIGLALLAARMQNYRPNRRHSYGYLRSGTVAAFVNAFILATVALSMIITGLLRLFHPVPIVSGPVLALALIALAFNLLSSWVLHTHDAHDLNLRAMFWHAISDALGSLAIVVAALLIRRTGWEGWDPLAAVLIGLAIARMAWTVAKPALTVLMEATPDNIDPEAIRGSLRALPEVDEIHHLHIWSIAPRYHALSAHVRLRDMSVREGQSVIDSMETLLAHQYHIHHVTIQIEAEQHKEPDPFCHV